MTTDEAEYRVIENTAAGRFELHRDSEVVSFAAFYEQGDTVVVPHVETLHQHRGQGHADRLMSGMLDTLRATERKITPVCSFAAAHLRDRPEQHDLIA